MIMNDITVEGFVIKIHRVGSRIGIMVPELPGVVGQVDREDQIRPEIGRLIRAHLEELAKERPKRKAERKSDTQSGPRKLSRP